MLKALKVGIEESSNGLVKSDMNLKRKWEKIPTRFKLKFCPSNVIFKRKTPTVEAIRKMAEKLKH